MVGEVRPHREQVVPFGTVVGHEEDERVVVLTDLLQVLEHAPHVGVEIGDHRRIDLHHVRLDLALCIAQIFPAASIVSPGVGDDVG